MSDKNIKQEDRLAYVIKKAKLAERAEKPNKDTAPAKRKRRTVGESNTETKSVSN